VITVSIGLTIFFTYDEHISLSSSSHLFLLLALSSAYGSFICTVAFHFRIMIVVHV